MDEAECLLAIATVLGPERPRRWPVTWDIIKKHTSPDAMPSAEEFAEVFEAQYDFAGRPLLRSSQFAFYMAAFLNSNWLTGRKVFEFGEEEDEENMFDRLLDLEYATLMVAADETLEQGQTFDLGVLDACVTVTEESLDPKWAWYLADALEKEPVILAHHIGCSLPRVVEAKLGKTRLAPPPGDVYILEELEVPYSYYEALTGKLHIADIVRLYIQNMPVEYAMAMH